MKAWMTHNPKCETSHNVLAILREKGIEPEIREYLKQPLTRAEIAALTKEMGFQVKDFVHRKQKDEVAAAGISEDSSDTALLAAMARYPNCLSASLISPSDRLRVKKLDSRWSLHSGRAQGGPGRGNDGEAEVARPGAEW
jgi:arsenate reductase